MDTLSIALRILNETPGSKLAVDIRAKQDFLKLCHFECIENRERYGDVTVLRNGTIIYWICLDILPKDSPTGLEVDRMWIS